MTIQHVVERAGAPIAPPPSLAAHYVDTSTGKQYLAKGTTSVDDWVLQEPGMTKAEADDAYQPKGNYQEAGNYATEQQLTQGLDGKVTAEEGKGLSSEDFTSDEKIKLAALQPGGEGGGGGLEVGDLLITARDPGADYLESNGSLKDQASYPALFSQVGILGTKPSDGVHWIQSEVTAGPSSSIATNGKGRWAIAHKWPAISISTDDGATWEKLVVGASNKMAWVSYREGMWMVVSEGTGNNVWVSTDDMATWQEYTAPATNNAEISSFQLVGDGVAILCTRSSNGVFITQDGGVTWAEIDDPAITPAGNNVCATGNMSGTILMGGSAIARSTDGGHTWEAVSVPKISITSIICLNSGRWLCCSLEGAAYSDDDGISWTAAEVPEGTGYLTLAVELPNGDLIAEVQSYEWPDYVARSEDGGATWATYERTGGPVYRRSVANYVMAGGIIMGVWGDYAMISPAADPDYDTDTQFLLPDYPVPAGLKAYIKAS